MKYELCYFVVWRSTGVHFWPLGERCRDLLYVSAGLSGQNGGSAAWRNSKHWTEKWDKFCKQDRKSQECAVIIHQKKKVLQRALIYSKADTYTDNCRQHRWVAVVFLLWNPLKRKHSTHAQLYSVVIRSERVDHADIKNCRYADIHTEPTCTPVVTKPKITFYFKM